MSSGVWQQNDGVDGHGCGMNDAVCIKNKRRRRGAKPSVTVRIQVDSHSTDETAKAPFDDHNFACHADPSSIMMTDAI